MTDWAIYSQSHRLLTEHGLACLGAGQHSGPSSGFGGRRRLGDYAIVFISSGTGVYRDPFVGRLDVNAPATIQVFPQRPHDYASPHGWTEHWVLYSGATVAAFEGMGVLDRRRPVQHGARLPSDLAGRFERLHDALGRPGWRAAVEASTLTQQLLADSVADRAASTASEATVAAVQADAALHRSVAARAALAGVSVSALRDQVREVTGGTPNELVIGTRIDRACGLLASTQLSVQAVAASVGYDDAAYFSRLFAQRVGMGPAQFRKRHRR
ncbi:helix-turn-helix domain-containing protein [Agromyces italicus]|uniref:helix-turn-helix domain-containing protein n=1 Tax=Agromyces italicus TaxID=279572 RepID=UPI0003B6704A|nr:AraC family transcriptional regulator [Agromyces italicus]